MLQPGGLLILTKMLSIHRRHLRDSLVSASIALAWLFVPLEYQMGRTGHLEGLEFITK